MKEMTAAPRTEATDDVRATLVFTNNHFERALEKFSLTIGDFCVEHRLPASDVAALMSLQISPLEDNGRYTALCRYIAFHLKSAPSAIFPRHLYEKALTQGWPAAMIFTAGSCRLLSCGKAVGLRSVRSRETELADADRSIEIKTEKAAQMGLILKALPELPHKCREILCSRFKCLNGRLTQEAESSDTDAVSDDGIMETQGMIQAIEMLRDQVRVLDLKRRHKKLA